MILTRGLQGSVQNHKSTRIDPNGKDMALHTQGRPSGAGAGEAWDKLGPSRHWHGRRIPCLLVPIHMAFPFALSRCRSCDNIAEPP